MKKHTLLKITLAVLLLLCMAMCFVACGDKKPQAPEEPPIENPGVEEPETFEATYYELVTNTNDLSSPTFKTFDKRTVTEGEVISTPMIMPEGYEDEHYVYQFYKWRTEDGKSTSGYIVNDDIKVFPVYTKKPKEYKVTFLNDGAFICEYYNLPYGSTIVYDELFPTKKSGENGYEYLFAGFICRETGKYFQESNVVTGDMIFDADFTKVKSKYTVTYYDFQGDVSYTEIYEYQDLLTRKSTEGVQRKGYAFEGYTYLDADGKVLSDEQISVTSDIQVIEKWSNPIKYNVNFHTPSKELKPESISYTIVDEDIILDENNSLTAVQGCNFIGWFDEKGVRVNTIHTDLAKNIELYAKFEIDAKITTDLPELINEEIVNLLVEVDYSTDIHATFQWYKDGVAIDEKMPSLKIIDENKSGIYHLEVTLVKYDDDNKEICKTVLSSNKSTVVISDGSDQYFKVTVVDAQGNPIEEFTKDYLLGGKLKLPTTLPDNTVENRKYVFNYWECNGEKVVNEKTVVSEMHITPVFSPVYIINYYNSVGDLVQTAEVVEGQLPQKPSSTDIEVKDGYVPTWNIDFNEPVYEDKTVHFKQELREDIQLFLEQSLDAVFTDREIGFTVNLTGVFDAKMFAVVKVTGLRVEDLHGEGANFTTDNILSMVDVKLSIGTTNAVKCHLSGADRTLYVQTKNGTFKISYDNLLNSLENTGFDMFKDLTEIVVNMVNLIDMTADTVQSIKLEGSTLTITPNLSDGLKLVIQSDYKNNKYSIKNINLTYGSMVNAVCSATTGLVIALDNEANASDYNQSIDDLITAAINLMNGRHYLIEGKVHLSSPSADIGVKLQVDRYEKGELDENGNIIPLTYSTMHVTLDIPKISLLITISNGCKSEIFIDSRYPDLILFKRTTLNGTVEHKDAKSFGNDTMALVTWLMNLGSIVDSFAGSSMSVTVDFVNLLKSAVYEAGTTTVVLDKNTIVFSDDLIGINKDITLGLNITDGYPTTLTINTAMSLAGILKPDITVTLNFISEVTKENKWQGTQASYQEVANTLGLSLGTIS